MTYETLLSKYQELLIEHERLLKWYSAIVESNKKLMGEIK